MPDSARIVLLANCGILIRYKGLNILVDGLYSDRNHSFSTLPSSLKRGLLAGTTAAGDIHYLLFTHLHPDHFGRRITKEFLLKNRVRGILLPQDHSNEWMTRRSDDMHQWMDEHNQPVQYMDFPRGKSQRFVLEPGFEVTAFNTGHQGEHMFHNANYVLLIRLGKINILVTGDAWYSDKIFEQVLDGIKVDAMLINPLFYQNKTGVAIVNEIIQPRVLVLYHIPFDGNDKYRIRRLSEHQLRRHQHEPYPIVALSEYLQVLEVPRAGEGTIIV